MPQAPIALSDAALTQIVQFAAPLTPQARSAFLAALAAELAATPQPAQDGEVTRAARAPLASGMFHRSPEFVADISYGTGEAKFRTRRVGTHRTPW
jgi:hypothetical protein